MRCLSQATRISMSSTNDSRQRSQVAAAGSPPKDIKTAFREARSASTGRVRSPERRPLQRTLSRNLQQQGSKTSIAPGQPAPGPRGRDKFVPLPVDVEDVPQAERPPPSFDPAQEDAQPEVGPGTRGRITVYCVSDSLDREMLDRRLQQRGPQFLLHSYPDALYGKYSELEHGIVGDVLYFDYGVVVLWGLSKKQEQDVLKNLVAPCQEAPLPAAMSARDEFQYNYAANEKAHIQNDTVTIDYRLSRNHMIKIAISHALAQSTKLVHFEARVLDIISNTKNLPEHLANTGEILLSKKQIAQLIGTVFIEKSRVNLLSTVLDTPEFFWDAPDSMQTLYERVCEYMELEERVRVLNNRYQVLTEMLDVLRDHQNNSHSAALEWIVIWLIVVCLFVGLFECTALVGWHK
ncbi:TPA: hypothetical protein ACH3X1_014968 [Trebouxia sp. C0004]